MARFTRSSALADSEAFSDLYERSAPDLLVWFARRVLQPDLALELTAETFARAYKSRRGYRGSTDSEAYAWLYAIAKRQLSDYFRTGEADNRALARLHIQVPDLSQEEFDRVEELADLAERRREVLAAMSDLPDDKRTALELRIVDELPYPQVASQLGITEVAARARVSRGLRTLAAALGIDSRTEKPQS